MVEQIYLKIVKNYDDILKNKKMPIIFSKIIFFIKNKLNIITKQRVGEKNIWIFPIMNNFNYDKLEKNIHKLNINQNQVLVLPTELENERTYILLKKYNYNFLCSENAKKDLLENLLNYILNKLKSKMENIDITILVNDASEKHLNIIENIAKKTKTIKIVSYNINKFKKIEANLYNEHGIAIQFSNSYKKSLEKSKLIINLDFMDVDINEYEINNNSIIVNCTDNFIKIKTKLFNGIVINSFNIKFKEIEMFENMELANNYSSLMLYNSLSVLRNIDKNKIQITALIGNNGKIDKKEFKNIKINVYK